MSLRRRRWSWIAPVLSLVVLVAFTIQAQVQGQEQTELTQQVRFDGHKVVRAEIQSIRDLRTMRAISDDMWSESAGIGSVDFRIAPEAMEALNDSGIEYVVMIEDVQPLIDLERANRGGGVDGQFFDQYHEYNEINQYLLDLENLNPASAERIEIGQSLEGRTVYGIRISAGGGGVLSLGELIRAGACSLGRFRAHAASFESMRSS